jgi:hypothetical protein
MSIIYNEWHSFYDHERRCITWGRTGWDEKEKRLHSMSFSITDRERIDCRSARELNELVTKRKEETSANFNSHSDDMAKLSG